jgi:hypothetical protein
MGGFDLNDLMTLITTNYDIIEIQIHIGIALRIAAYLLDIYLWYWDDYSL